MDSIEIKFDENGHIISGRFPAEGVEGRLIRLKESVIISRKLHAYAETPGILKTLQQQGNYLFTGIVTEITSYFEEGISFVTVSKTSDSHIIKIRKAELHWLGKGKDE